MTQPIQVEAVRGQPRLDVEADLRRIRRLAKLLDARFSLGGVQFGYDAIVGLVPVVGDIVTALLALYPVYLARRHGLGGMLVARMVGNVLLDWLIGAVPLVGDLLDVAYKANLRNLELFERALRRTPRS